jgi:hypothetical protein
MMLRAADGATRVRSLTIPFAATGDNLGGCLARRFGEPQKAQRQGTPQRSLWDLSPVLTTAPAGGIVVSPADCGAILARVTSRVPRRDLDEIFVVWAGSLMRP